MILDHCMELRENAGGDENLFSVERRMRKQQQKLEQQRQKQYQREKEREENNVFNFINATLGDKRTSKKILLSLDIISTIYYLLFSICYL